MKDKYIRNGIFGFILTTAGAGCSYYFFTDRSPDNNLYIEITQSTEYISGETIVGIAKNITKDKIDDEIGDNIRYYLPGYIEIEKFDISNYSDTYINNVSVSFHDPLYASFGFKNAAIDPSSDSYTFNMPPHSSTNLTLASDGPFIDTDAFKLDRDVIFSINGKDIPVYKDKRMIDWSGFIWHELLLKGMYSLLFIGFVSVVYSIIRIMIFLLKKTHPEISARTVTTSKLGHYLATINYMRQRDPARYNKVVAFAERIYERWTENNKVENQ